MSTHVATAILNVVFIRYCATRIKENTALFNIRRREKGERTGIPDSPAWRMRRHGARCGKEQGEV